VQTVVTVLTMMVTVCHSGNGETPVIILVNILSTTVSIFNIHRAQIASIFRVKWSHCVTLSIWSWRQQFHPKHLHPK
jgi:hypothetical protein